MTRWQRILLGSTLVVSMSILAVCTRKPVGKNLVRAADWEVACPRESCWVAPQVSRIDDLNGDGLADLVVMTHEHGGAKQIKRSRLEVYAGSPEGLSEEPFWRIESPSFFSGVAAVDIDGDGDADLVVGAPDDRLEFFQATGGAFATVPTWELQRPLVGRSYSGFGRALARAGDVDGDGDEDLIVGASHAESRYEAEGGVFLVDGSPDGPRLGSWSVFGGGRITWLGTSLLVTDLDGDHRADILASAPGAANLSGALHLYRDLGGAFATIPQIIPAPSGASRFFGGALSVDALGTTKSLVVNASDTMIGVSTSRHPLRSGLVLSSSGFVTQSAPFPDIDVTWTAQRPIDDLNSDGCPEQLFVTNFVAERSEQSALGAWLGLRPPAPPEYPGLLGGTSQIVLSHCQR